MAAKKKHVIRVVFDVLDGMKHNIRLNEDLSVAAADPDEAIEWVWAEMQRQFKRLHRQSVGQFHQVWAEMQRQFKQSDIRLARVRICA